MEYTVLTLRVVYWILARQYDPLGFIIPFMAHAKVLLQQLWIKPSRGWDDPDIPEGIKAAMMAWEGVTRFGYGPSTLMVWSKKGLGRSSHQRASHIL